MNQTLACGIVAALALSGSAQAGFIDLSGGWRAQWDPALDGFVDIADDGVVNGVQFFEKTIEFLDGPPNPGDPFPAVVITFIQLEEDAVSQFGIDDEALTNSTGLDWTDFHMEVIGEPGTAFNPALTAASGGGGPIGFSISPFTNAMFGPGNTSLWIDGGVVADGEVFRPGSGATDGILYIDAPTVPGALRTFNLVERPTPAPGGVAALGLLGLAGLRRRVR